MADQTPYRPPADGLCVAAGQLGKGPEAKTFCFVEAVLACVADGGCRVSVDRLELLAGRAGHFGQPSFDRWLEILSTGEDTLFSDRSGIASGSDSGVLV